jgi:hypothetical protein
MSNYKISNDYIYIYINTWHKNAKSTKVEQYSKCYDIGRAMIGLSFYVR